LKKQNIKIGISIKEKRVKEKGIEEKEKY